jgi:hypothetical protein
LLAVSFPGIGNTFTVKAEVSSGSSLILSRFKKIFRILLEMHPVVQCSFHSSLGPIGGPTFFFELDHCGGQALFFFLCRNVSLHLEMAPGSVAGPCRNAIRRYPA